MESFARIIDACGKRNTSSLWVYHDWFEKMLVDVESQKAEIEETIQVLDVREAIKGVSGDSARIFAAVKFNQSFGESQEGAEFGITLQAFKKDADSSSHELVRSDEKLSSDRDPSTWDQVSSEMIIPTDAQFVVVSLTARKFGLTPGVGEYKFLLC